MSSQEALPPIPAKRYFTIGEVAQLCGVKPHVLRYWEQEFSQLRPMKRRGNRRYYQHHEVLMIRRIRELLYDQGFTISGARNKMLDSPEPEVGEKSLSGFDAALAATPLNTDSGYSNSGLSLDRQPSEIAPKLIRYASPAANAQDVVFELKELLKLLSLDEKKPD